MVRCKSCGRTTKNPKADNWKKRQLCYPCDRKENPQLYEDKPEHGTGGSRMHMKLHCGSLIAKDLNTAGQS